MQNNYKRTFSALFSLLTFSILTYAQIPNAGFENWHSAGFPSYNDPDSWGTLNGSTSIIGVYTAEKATGAGNFHSGTAAIKLSTHYISFASQTAPGIVTTGTINTNTQALEGGFTINYRPLALKGWYKGTPAANDSSQIEVFLWKWDAINQIEVEVGSAKFVNSAAVSSFTQFSVPITYALPDMPDSGRITMSSSNTDNPVDGSVFYVDDLSFVTCTGFSASSSSTNATCTASDGSATYIATGGSTPYTYLWSTSASSSTINNVAAGNYQVTVTDAVGCSATASVTVNATITALNVTTNSTPSSCAANDGTASASTLSGTSPYSFAWSNQGTDSVISNVGPGVYNVTVTDVNGCAGTASATVNTPSGPSATSVANSVDCHGNANGSVVVSVTGGTNPLSYLWNTNDTTANLNNVAGGNYSLTITDANNCSFVVSETVAEPEALGDSVTVTNVACYGDSTGYIDVQVRGGTSPFSFTEDPGNPAHGQVTFPVGTYIFTITDGNGCSLTDTAEVTQPSAALAVVLTPTDASSASAMDGAMATTVTGGTPPYTYTWNTFVNTSSLDSIGVGTYCVHVTDNNGCLVNACDDVAAPNAIQGNAADFISIYPNPTHGQVTIENTLPQSAVLKIYAEDGKVWIQTLLHEGKNTVDTHNLPDGTYIYSVKGIHSNISMFGKLQSVAH